MIEILTLIASDWKRYTGLHKKMNPLLFLVVLFRNPGMHFSVLYRLEFYLFNSKNLILKIISAIFYPFYFIITYYIFDIDISPRVKIGSGLYIHNKGIIFTDLVVAGKNLTLIAPLTLGVKGWGYDLSYAPTLGNNVVVYTGARIIGKVKIGNNVSIGANAVVIKNIPNNCIVGGIPAKILRRLK
ncbi:MAG TPA: hypothetical protein VFI61_01445 [Patescibacteria group bacterium]|nr:hypothetical protein [Patescibacteria group bacterium]